MQIGILPFLVFPMLVISIGLLVIYYYSKKKTETEYEKELRVLRKLKFSGQLDKKRYSSIRNRLYHDKVSSEQEERLERMFREDKIDSMTFNRLKKALHMSLDNKFKKAT